MICGKLGGLETSALALAEKGNIALIVGETDVKSFLKAIVKLAVVALVPRTLTETALPCDAGMAIVLVVLADVSEKSKLTALAVSLVNAT